MGTETNPSSFLQKPTGLRRIWTLVRVINVRLRFIFLMILVGLIVGYWETIANYYDRWRRPAVAPDLVQNQEVEFYCPMHPSVIRAEPGNCPICGMPLVKRAKTQKGALPEGVLARVNLTPTKVQLGRIATSPVEYRLLAREIRTVGLVDYDETRRAFIAARIKGRIDKLLVNYIGQHVEQGDPLAWIYSPALFAAQEELLTSARRVAELKGTSGLEYQNSQVLLAAARQKLVLWGITDEQIDEIVRRGTVQTHLIVYSPMAGIVTDKKVLEGHYVNEGDDLYTIADLNRVWMQTKIFEDQIAGVQVGTAVQVTATAYPNETFAGRITFIAYTVEPETRTVAARVEIDNLDYKLKPGMYANAVIRVPVGEVTELGDGPAASQPATKSEYHTDALAAAYLSLVTAFARDATDESAAAEIINAAQALAENGPDDVRVAAKDILDQARRLRGAELEKQRAILKPLSRSVIDLLRAHPPAGETLFIAHCPMVEADWLQSGQTIANPYYGSSMLRCGSVTGKIEPGGQASAERFATGYFCPVYPDRLFEKAQQCPIDKFPLKYVRLEKVLSVPQSAVVRTGARQIVYRQSDAGVFDMIEVQVGPRAGESYPVLSGLQAGERVATAGAFLVDAENRLNPAAAVQYLGTTEDSTGGREHQHAH